MKFATVSERVATPLRLWAAPVVFIVIALAMHAFIEPLRPAGPALDLQTSLVDWLSSPALEACVVENGVIWRRVGPGPAVAARPVVVPPTADFLRVAFCPVNLRDPLDVYVTLASVREERLDLNRHHKHRGLYGAEPGACVEDDFSRLPGDGQAFVQLGLSEDLPALEMRRMTAFAMQETSLWRVLRMFMLVTGLCLLLLPFGRYLRGTGILAWPGLLGVAGIIFGCCITVGLKSEIYQLMTGGATRPLPVTLEALLAIESGGVGLGIFTSMHAMLFGATTLLLGLTGRRAWLDMAMLAAFTETLQIFVPGRGPGLSDVVVDLSGVGWASLLLFLLWRSQRVRLFLQNQ